MKAKTIVMFFVMATLHLTQGGRHYKMGRPLPSSRLDDETLTLISARHSMVEK